MIASISKVIVLITIFPCILSHPCLGFFWWTGPGILYAFERVPWQRTHLQILSCHQVFGVFLVCVFLFVCLCFLWAYAFSRHYVKSKEQDDLVPESCCATLCLQLTILYCTIKKVLRGLFPHVKCSFHNKKKIRRIKTQHLPLWNSFGFLKFSLSSMKQVFFFALEWGDERHPFWRFFRWREKYDIALGGMVNYRPTKVKSKTEDVT